MFQACSCVWNLTGFIAFSVSVSKLHYDGGDFLLSQIDGHKHCRTNYNLLWFCSCCCCHCSFFLLCAMLLVSLFLFLQLPLAVRRVANEMKRMRTSMRIDDSEFLLSFSWQWMKLLIHFYFFRNLFLLYIPVARSLTHYHRQCWWWTPRSPTCSIRYKTNEERG